MFKMSLISFATQLLLVSQANALCVAGIGWSCPTETTSQVVETFANSHISFEKAEFKYGELCSSSCHYLHLSGVQIQQTDNGETGGRQLGDVLLPLHSEQQKDHLESVFSEIEKSLIQLLKNSTISISQTIPNNLENLIGLEINQPFKVGFIKWTLSAEDSNRYLEFGLSEEKLARLAQGNILDKSQMVTRNPSRHSRKTLELLADGIRWKTGEISKAGGVSRCEKQRIDILGALREKYRELMSDLVKITIDRVQSDVFFSGESLQIQGSLLKIGEDTCETHKNWEITESGYDHYRGCMDAVKLLNSGIIQAARDLGIIVMNLGEVKGEMGTAADVYLRASTDPTDPDMFEIITNSVVTKGNQNNRQNPSLNSNLGSYDFLLRTVTVHPKNYFVGQVFFTQIGNYLWGTDISNLTRSIGGTGGLSLIQDKNIDAVRITTDSTGDTSIVLNSNIGMMDSFIGGTGGTVYVANSHIGDASFSYDTTGASQYMFKNTGDNWLIHTSDQNTGGDIVLANNDLNGDLLIENDGTGPSTTLGGVRARNIVIYPHGAVYFKKLYAEEMFMLCSSTSSTSEQEANDIFRKALQLGIQISSVGLADRTNHDYDENRLRARENSARENLDRYRDSISPGFIDHPYAFLTNTEVPELDLSLIQNSPEYRDRMRPSYDLMHFENARRESRDFERTLHDMQFSLPRGVMGTELDANIVVLQDDGRGVYGKANLVIAHSRPKNLEYKHFINISDL